MTDETVYRQIKGKSGKTWLVGIIPEAASRLYVTNNASNTTGKGGGYGFGGATISFPTEDGPFEAHGPWHSNAESLYEDTGLDVRHLHLTRVTVSSERNFDDQSFRSVPGGEIYYQEEVPAMGIFHRGEKIAKAIADLYQKDVWLLSESNGGSASMLIKHDV